MVWPGSDSFKHVKVLFLLLLFAKCLFKAHLTGLTNRARYTLWLSYFFGHFLPTIWFIKNPSRAGLSWGSIRSTHRHRVWVRWRENCAHKLKFLPSINRWPSIKAAQGLKLDVCAPRSSGGPRFISLICLLFNEVVVDVVVIFCRLPLLLLLLLTGFGCCITQFRLGFFLRLVLSFPAAFQVHESSERSVENIYHWLDCNFLPSAFQAGAFKSALNQNESVNIVVSWWIKESEISCSIESVAMCVNSARHLPYAVSVESWRSAWFKYGLETQLKKTQ